jgi:hypothetical protein
MALRGSGEGTFAPALRFPFHVSTPWTLSSGGAREERAPILPRLR